MAETVSDPRWLALVKIPGTESRPAIGIGVPQGPSTAPLNVLASAVAGAAARFRAVSAEVRTSRLLDSERGARIRESASPVIDTLRTAAATFNQERPRIQVLARTSYVKPYSDSTHYATVAVDIALAQKFASMTEAEKKTVVGLAAGDPAKHLRWVEALTRTPHQLSDVAPADVETLRVETMAALAPDEWQAIQTQVAQLAHARTAIAAGVTVLGEEISGVTGELLALAPEALAIAREAT